MCLVLVSVVCMGVMNFGVWVLNVVISVWVENRKILVFYRKLFCVSIVLVLVRFGFFMKCFSISGFLFVFLVFI